ncbi:prophage endopeptidase tail family protein [Carnobacterium maltaromaticum]|uniref:prophage endopeptidase tail family protein n=1 Tax=Carnobacterium maltaromaticum TaxID=2751 RepID=UPI000550415B|nr:prophage endopeptidase tail family protein [Carnobacterium maltaromaticum]
MKPLIVKTKEHEEILIDFQDFQYEWQKNEVNQISFSIVETEWNKFGYFLLSDDESIIFNDQEYLIKNCNPKTNGSKSVKAITAMHIYYDCKYVYQYDVKEGVKTYSIQDILHFYFDGNAKGYSWEVIGEFPKVEVDNLGNGSGKECVDMCIEKFNCVVEMNNKHIRLIDEELWKIMTDHEFVYYYNTDDIQLTSTSTDIYNITKCFGKKKEDGSDYFAPFIYRSEASIERWGEKPGPAVSDERFTDAAAMKEKAKASLQDQPAVTLSVQYKGKEPVKPGEVWILNHKKMNFLDDVVVSGIRSYSYSSSQFQEVILSNSKKDMLRIQLAMEKASANSSFILNNSYKFVSDNIPETIKKASMDVNKSNQAIEFLESGLKSKWSEQDVKDYYE